MKKDWSNPEPDLTPKPEYPGAPIRNAYTFAGPRRLEHNIVRAMSLRMLSKADGLYYELQPGREIRVNANSADFIVAQLTVVAARSSAYFAAMRGGPTQEPLKTLLDVADIAASAFQTHDSGLAASLLFHVAFEQGAIDLIHHKVGEPAFRQNLKLWLDFRKKYLTLFEWPDPIEPRRNHLATNARFHVDQDGVTYYPSYDCAPLWPPSPRPPTLVAVFP